MVNAFPNPFNPSIALKYELLKPGRVSVEVYDVAGKRAALLRDGLATAGEHILTCNARDSGGHSLSSGVYFVRIRYGAETLSKKILLLR